MNRKKTIATALAVSVLLTGCSKNSPGYQYKEALKYYDSQDYEKACEYFENAISANDDKAEYHIDYGMALIQKNEYEKAKEQFLRVIMDKNIPIVLANNKKAYCGLGILEFMQDNFEEALSYFAKALEIKEATELDTDILYYETVVYERCGNIEDAINTYTQILTLDNNAAVYKARANAYRLTGEYEKSLADYEAALKKNKNDFELYFGQYTTLMELGRTTEAKEVLSKAAEIKIDPDNNNDRYQMAKVQFYEGNTEQAVNGMQYAVSKGITEAYFYLGEMELMEYDYESAKSYFLSYLDAGEKTSAVFYNQLITCCLNTDDLENVSDYIKAAKLTEDAQVKYPLMRNEVIYLERTGKFEEAYKKIQQYLDKFPDDEDAKKDAYFLQTRVEQTSSADAGDKNDTAVKP